MSLQEVIGHHKLLGGGHPSDKSRALSPPLIAVTSTNDSVADLSSIDVSPMIMPKNLLMVPIEMPAPYP